MKSKKFPLSARGKYHRKHVKPDKTFIQCPICELFIEDKNYKWHIDQHTKDEQYFSKHLGVKRGN